MCWRCWGSSPASPLLLLLGNPSNTNFRKPMTTISWKPITNQRDPLISKSRNPYHNQHFSETSRTHHFLKRWTEKLAFREDEVTSIPVWVKFPNLRMSCRAVNGLSKFASCIGTPICMDHYTTSTSEKLTFARVLVEVFADDPLPHSITVRCKGTSFEQPVEYR